VLTAASRTAWQIDDVMPAHARLDFTRPFLPEALARTDSMRGFGGTERLLLNHIRGNEYLSLFGLIEEFILPFLLDHIRDQGAGEDHRTRALLQFAGEEAKHIHLFKRFRDAFDAGFRSPCSVIGPGETIAAEVLRHHPLGVALVILQIEWMTQSHYLDSIRSNTALDPLFASLLRHHWMEEAQHAKLDTLIVEALAATLSAEEIDAAVEDYFRIAAFLDGGLKAQTQFNLAAFEMASGRTLDTDMRQAFLDGQHQAQRWTYLGSGMTHPKFRAALGAISPAGLARVDAAAPQFC
jgi:hypothetical protein